MIRFCQFPSPEQPREESDQVYEAPVIENTI